MKSAIQFALLGLVLVIVAMVSALTAMRFAIHGQVVEVPPLVGLGPAEAEKKVAGVGLQISIERQYYSPQIAEGKIMSQLPAPGAKPTNPAVRPAPLTYRSVVLRRHALGFARVVAAPWS